MAWLKSTKKVVASCDKPGGGAGNLRSLDHRMRHLYHVKAWDSLRGKITP